MNPFLGVREGFREVYAHKFRSFLTMLGVILGVASLMAMYALTEGMAEGSRQRLVESGGVERVRIMEMPVPDYQEEMAEISPGLVYNDAVALRQNTTLLSAIAPSVNHGGNITRGARAYNPRLHGVEPDTFVVDKHELARGRFITDLDVERRHRVIVIGHTVMEELYDESEFDSVLGSKIHINDEPFIVVGVLERYMTEQQRRREQSERFQKQQERRAELRGRGHSWDPLGFKNRMAAIPITTMQQVFKSSYEVDGINLGADKSLNSLYVQVADLDRFDEAITQIRNVLDTTHRGIQDYGFETRQDWFENIEAGVRAAQLTGGLIAAISLLVGGIGITNIMLASITERIREIGIRRAVGATQMDIFTQIVIESLVLAIIGAFLGLAAGMGLIEVLTVLGGDDADPPILRPFAVLVSLAFATGVGLVAGIYPAWKASRLSPIQALRYE
ncbi:MAG: ABC transporter permease [Verrucomicrobiota bacterium]